MIEDKGPGLYNKDGVKVGEILVEDKEKAEFLKKCDEYSMSKINDAIRDLRFRMPIEDSERARRYRTAIIGMEAVLADFKLIEG